MSGTKDFMKKKLVKSETAPAVDLHRVDGRTGRTEDVDEKRWWLVWYRVDGAQSVVKLATIEDAVISALDKAEFKEVTDIRIMEAEVVERRRTVATVTVSSPIDLSSAPASAPK